MILAADEFIRRFLLHALPDGFHRIRHYGFLGNRHRAEKLALCRRLLAISAAAPPDNADKPGPPQGRSSDTCPCCGGRMEMVGPLPRSRQPIPRHGTTAHEPRGLVLMINTLAIFAVSTAGGREVVRHAAPAALLSLGSAGGLGIAFVNGTPVRPSPVTAPLPVCLRAIFPLPTPAFYSP